MPKRAKHGGKKPGPKEDRLKLEGDWRDIAKKAARKKRPKKWPEGQPDEKQATSSTPTRTPQGALR